MEYILKELRKQLADYRSVHQGTDISTTVNFIEIALCLVEYGLIDKRPIKAEEENWFNAGMQVDYIFPSGSEWYILAEYYHMMCDEAERNNFFRK